MNALAQERSQVQWGTTLIPYRIRRSSRKKTVAVTVAPPGEVVLTAPRGVGVDRLDRIVRAKAPWIAAKVRKVKQALPPASTREFVSGESFLYLGRQYRLEVRKDGDDTNEVRLHAGKLRVAVPARVDSGKIPGMVRGALVDWYRQHASARFAERAEYWAGKLGVPKPKVLVREQEKRWGSCAGGLLRFNWRIVQAPMRLLDYVVAHELVHLSHRDHDRAFWSTLGGVMADYEDRKGRLREIGTMLTW